MENEKRLIDAEIILKELRKQRQAMADMNDLNGVEAIDDAIREIENAPVVDAVALPKGKPGDYLEWDNGAGFRQIYGIGSVNFCFDGTVRYDIEIAQPVVNHPGIVRILTAEEAKREWEERCAKDGFPKEEPTFTAYKGGTA